MVKKLNTIQQLTKAQQQRSRVAIAASGLTMADGLSQDPLLAQVRLRNGEMVYVKDLPPIDMDDPQPNGDYQIALVADHDGVVKSQAGASWLFLDDDEVLKALTTYSDNSLGNELLPLANDGFLQFSTEGYIDENEIDANGKYGDFWISELAPVTTGNDPGTQVLNGNRVLITNAFSTGTKGDTMADKPGIKKTTEKKNVLAPDDEKQIQTMIDTTVAAALKQAAEDDVNEDDVDPAVANDVEGDEVEEDQDDSDDDEVEEEKEEAVATNKVRTTPKAKISNTKPRQTIAGVKENRGEEEEIVAFSNALAQATRDRSGASGVRAAMNVYYSKKKTNVITGDDFVPTSLAVTFFKAWLDNENMKFAKFMNTRAGAVYAAESTDTALDHAPGGDKADQTIALSRRDLKAIAIYKRLPIDAQDLFDDHDGNLMKFRTQELSSRVANQILVAAVKGGNTPGSVGSTNGGGTRGLFGIIPDAAAGSGFGAQVATTVSGLAGEDPYAAVIKTLDAIQITNGGNITSAGLASTGISLIVPTGWIAKILLTKNSSGNYQFTRDNINALLGISSLTMMPELVATQDIVAVADGAYQLFGENAPKVYPFFDTVTNQDVLLVEQFIAGSLAGFKQAAVYVPHAGS